VFIVVSYDIVSDRRRIKIAKALEDYGTRVQYSVFECNISNSHLAEMKRRIARLMNIEEDRIRYYRLCEDCLTGVELVGKGEITKDRDFYVV